jgi:hypothetical protein
MMHHGSKRHGLRCGSNWGAASSAKAGQRLECAGEIVLVRHSLRFSATVLIDNGKNIADKSSRSDIEKNGDGSVDIYSGRMRRRAVKKTGFRPLRAKLGLPTSDSMDLSQAAAP